MRTSEERVEELHQRMSMRRKTQSNRRYRMIWASAHAACLVIVALVAVGISRVPVHMTDVASGGVSASIFADHPALGYMVVAILAFCLGTLTNVFCHRLKKHMEEDGKSDVREL